MTIFFTSDHHFGHRNIIKYENRPFKSVEEMDEELINRWNSVVKKNDAVYHLGDFTLGNRKNAQDYFPKLNGRIFILGNFWHHDARWIQHAENFYVSKDDVYVVILPPIVVLEKPTIVLCHYPFAVWDRKHYGSIHLHGHSHCKYIPPKDDLCFDVGVDCWDFYPVTLDQILENK